MMTFFFRYRKTGKKSYLRSYTAASMKFSNTSTNLRLAKNQDITQEDLLRKDIKGIKKDTK